MKRGERVKLDLALRLPPALRPRRTIESETRRLVRCTGSPGCERAIRAALEWAYMEGQRHGILPPGLR